MMVGVQDISCGACRAAGRNPGRNAVRAATRTLRLHRTPRQTLSQCRPACCAGAVVVTALSFAVSFGLKGGKLGVARGGTGLFRCLQYPLQLPGTNLGSGAAVHPQQWQALLAGAHSLLGRAGCRRHHLWPARLISTAQPRVLPEPLLCCRHRRVHPDAGAGQEEVQQVSGFTATSTQY